MELGNKIEIREIVVDARSGGHVNLCIAQTICLSVREKCNVTLMHNDKSYPVDYDELIKSYTLFAKRVRCD